MANSATGRQKDWALALGLPVSDMTTREEMSAMLTSIKEDYNCDATADQHRLAAGWGVVIPVHASRYEGAGVLFEFLLARAWVYSVCRHMTNAKWRFQSECSLPTQTINAISRAVYLNREVFSSILEKNPRSSATGDAWFQIGKNAPLSKEYRMVVALVHQCLGELPQEPLLVVRHARLRSRQKSGCLSIFLTIVIVLGVTLFVTF